MPFSTIRSSVSRMKDPIVILGIGELGGVFARGFLRIGHPVHPIIRSMSLEHEAEQIPDPELVLIAVGEESLHPILQKIPQSWRGSLALLQNELLPRDWEANGIEDPTVISVWFDKKPGRDVKSVMPSAVFGPAATLIRDALGALGIVCRVLPDAEQLLFTLVLKNLYIWTINIAGLETGGTVSELWRDHHQLASEIAHEVIDIQEYLTGRQLPRERLIQGLADAFNLDPGHKCTGRTAPARLRRALEHANKAHLAVPALQRIQARHPFDMEEP
jgi:hypothetical protein